MKALKEPLPKKSDGSKQGGVKSKGVLALWKVDIIRKKVECQHGKKTESRRRTRCGHQRRLTKKTPEELLGPGKYRCAYKEGREKESHG